MLGHSKHGKRAMRRTVSQEIAEDGEVPIVGIDNVDAFEEEGNHSRKIWDETSEKKLDPKLVSEARKEEVR